MKILVFSFFVLFVTFANASDETDCIETCTNEYTGTESEKAACLFGCDGRKAFISHPRDFRSCLTTCNDKYSNETLEGEAKACKFACSLPFTQRISMTLDMSEPNPKYRIEHLSGKEAKVFDPSFDDILMKPRIFVNSPNDDIFPPSLLDGDSEVTRTIQNVMRNMLERAREDMRQMTEGEMSLRRPAGHDLIALRGPEVGNGKDGKPIILETDDVIVSDAHRRHNQSIRWVVLMFAMVFLIISVICVAIFFRRPGIEEYVRMRNAYRQNLESNSSETLPAKKSMIVEDGASGTSWQHKEPEGEAPPAYDQLSVHLSHEQNEEQH